MAVTGSSSIPPPDPSTLLTPLLPALTAAAASHEPAVGVLPLLTPILRQRVQFLSASSSEPWLRLLCYDHSKARQLAEVVAAPSSALEPHPVSGEVEVDWDYDAQKRYRRVDSETLQSLYVLGELGLAFQLVYCVGDPDGGDGWRVGEVTVADKSDPFATFRGAPTLDEAEKMYADGRNPKASANHTVGNGAQAQQASIPQQQQDDGDDDDDYWALYDATPGRTPAKHSPAPQAYSAAARMSSAINGTTMSTEKEETDYYAQYDSVQPIMDNHDPDEELGAEQLQAEPPLGLGADTRNGHLSPPSEYPVLQKQNDAVGAVDESLLHPRPESSASSNSSQVVARLEEEAGRQGQSEFGVKQHISRSVRSLFMLSRASGIEKEEFERLVKTELDLLGMMEAQDA